MRLAGLDLGRLAALVHKESRQMWRDPSTVLIAFVLPVVMIFLYAYAVNLDLDRVPVGVVLESDGRNAQDLAAAFSGSRYFEVHPARDRREVQAEVLGGRLRGFVVIPQDLDRRLAAAAGAGPGAEPRPLVQVVTDGTQPNTAGFVATFATSVVANWQAGRGRGGGVVLEPRFWYNPELESRRFLLPGAIAIIMTMIGTLLTAMVVAREWERGTMEAVLSTPVSVFEILVGKLLPYFVLAMAATVLCTIISVGVFGVPLRGSWLSLLVLSSAFLVPALGQGLLISALSRNQFVAAQFALMTGFLPAFMLSGFIFEISSMPAPLRLITYLVPARYFVAALQTVFLAGDVWAVFVPNTLAMLAIGLVFLLIARTKTKKSLDI
jgi:ABC-2 type transport system permease protein